MWRGRGGGGRGGRGGFGRGGGGRGGGFSAAVARDDGGAVVWANKDDGPPLLFPEVSVLPELPDILTSEEALLHCQRRLVSFWRHSPYHVAAPPVKPPLLPSGQPAGASLSDLQRYSSQSQASEAALMAASTTATTATATATAPYSSSQSKPPLSHFMDLSAASFPAELLGKASQSRASKAAWVAASAAAGGKMSDLRRLDQLALLEQRMQRSAEDKEGKEEEPKEGEEEEGQEEEEEEEIGEDDYAQNFGFDDDDDYLDDDDGADEGPVF